MNIEVCGTYAKSLYPFCLIHVSIHLLHFYPFLMWGRLVVLLTCGAAMSTLKVVAWIPGRRLFPCLITGHHTTQDMTFMNYFTYLYKRRILNKIKCDIYFSNYDVIFVFF